MKRHSITAESRLTLIYVFALSQLESQSFSVVDAWVLALYGHTDENGRCIVATASSDGAARLIRKSLYRLTEYSVLYCLAPRAARCSPGQQRPRIIAVFRGVSQESRQGLSASRRSNRRQAVKQRADGHRCKGHG